MSRPTRLSNYPFVVVRLSCGFCSRRGAYRLARLAHKFGSEARLEEVLDALAADCPWRGPHRRRNATCAACFADIDGAPRPPDMPPQGLRVIAGGRRD